MKNYYKVLELSQNASLKEIEEAYQLLARKYDPARHKGSRLVEEKFIDITIAHKTLTDSDKRKDYDRILKSLYPDTYTADIKEEKNKHTREAASRKKMSVTYIVLALFLLSAVWMVRHQLFEKAGQRDHIAASIPPAVLSPAIRQASLAAASITTPTKPATVPQVTQKPAGQDVKAQRIIHTLNIMPPAINKAAVLMPADTAQIATLRDTLAYAIGDSKNMVLSVQGTPGTITKYNDGSETWNYGKSTVFFENGTLKSYNNTDNNLLLKK